MVKNELNFTLCHIITSRPHLKHPIHRDIPTISQYKNLMDSSGISNNSTVILYGDGKNRSATWTYWIMKLFSHNDVRIMNGGRSKWIKEKLNGTPIQGGLDPKILLTDKENIKANVEKYLNIFKDYPYIFNLGHGVLPETKPEIIEYIINIVRNKK